jgi:hypothetical protein
MFARVMKHRHLADHEAARGCQDGDKAMQFPIEFDLAKDFAAVGLQPAVVVVQTHSGQHPYGRVEPPAGDDFVPGIFSILFPTADNVFPLRDRR